MKHHFADHVGRRVLVDDPEPIIPEPTEVLVEQVSQGYVKLFFTESETSMWVEEGDYEIVAILPADA